MENEQRQPGQPHMPGQIAKGIGILLHAVADKDHGLNGLLLMFAQGMAQDLGNLGPPAQAAHRQHGFQQRPGIVMPAGSLAFAETAVEDQLDGQIAQAAHGLEHLRLNGAGIVPAGLATGGGIHGKDDPPLPAAARGRARHLVEKGFDIPAGAVLALDLPGHTASLHSFRYRQYGNWRSSRPVYTRNGRPPRR